MEYHPRFPTFGQCVSKGYFSSKIHERIYTLSTLAVMYFLPLLVILFCYPAILLKIHISARESLQGAYEILFPTSYKTEYIFRRS